MKKSAALANAASRRSCGRSRHARTKRVGAEAVRGAGTWLENSLVRVDVDPADGTFSINGVARLGRLVDDGEEGDTYNHSPPGREGLRNELVVRGGLLERICLNW